jgi:signal transduction histidine kinase
MEQQLADQAALTQLGQLAAVVAHEVRNPLAGIKGSLQVLRSRSITQTTDQRVVDAMISRIDVLNNKVEDILRFARPRVPVLETIDVRPVLIDAAASAEAATNGACPAIHVPDASALVRADREMLRAVLLNLLLNACQSGSTDPIDVVITVASDIADRGTGFGTADPEQLFEAFHTTKKSGTGLGLAIVRRLVSLQGGSVALMAREGGGAIARLRLPVAPHES